MNIKQAFANAPEHQSEAPIPLVREIPDPAPLAPDALGPLQRAAEAIRQQTQAPFEIAAQSVLAAASLAARPHRNVSGLGGEAPISLYLITIAASGERKSTSDRLATYPIAEFERELAAEYRAGREKYENEAALYEATKSEIVKKGKADRDGMRADLEALGGPPQPPLRPMVVVSEPTFEGLVKSLDQGRPSLGIFSDEAGLFLGGHAMNADNRLKTVSGFSKLWDGAPINRTRAGDGVATYYGRRVAMHFMAQPGAADTLLSDPMARDQGLLSRCLIARPRSTIGTRLIGDAVAMSQVSQRPLAEFHSRIRDLLRLPLPLREGTRNELSPPSLELDKQARRLLIMFANSVERQLAHGAGSST